MATQDERETLLRAILDDPDDDEKRLAYATWLDSHGEADRARVIRLMIEADNLSQSDPRREGLLQEAYSLIKRHGKFWLADLPKDQKVGMNYRRGFVDEVRFENPKDFLREEESIFDREPIQAVEITLGPGDIDQVAQHRPWTNIRSLTLRAKRGLEDRHVADFLSSPYLRQLAWLAIIPWIPTRKQRAAEGLPDHSGGLDLSTGLHTLRVISLSPKFSGLEHLDFSRIHVGDAGAALLAESPVLRHLEYLDLSSCSIGLSGLRALGRSPILTKLIVLKLNDSCLDGENGRAFLEGLAESGQGTNISELLLNGMNIGDEGVELLTTTSLGRAGSLTTLDISSNALGHKAIEALVSSPLPTSLEALDLSHNEITDRGLATLLSSGVFPHLKTLTLFANHLSFEGLKPLHDSPIPSRLEDLSISCGNIGDEGAELIAATSWPQLRSLDLVWCGIGDRGAEAILNSRMIPDDLERLNLEDNDISPSFHELFQRRFPKASFMPWFFD